MSSFADPVRYMQDRRLERLEADAIAMPDNPARQAEFYRVSSIHFCACARYHSIN
jgi:hypothetical protein